MEKPPLGIVPLPIYRDERIIDLSRAIMEYTRHGYNADLILWGKELLKLLEEKYNKG